MVGLGEGDETGISTTRLVAVEFIGMLLGILLIAGVPSTGVREKLQAAPAKMTKKDRKIKIPRVLVFLAIIGVDLDLVKPILDRNDFDHDG